MGFHLKLQIGILGGAVEEGLPLEITIRESWWSYLKDAFHQEL